MSSTKNQRGVISTTGDTITLNEGSNETDLTNTNSSGSSIAVNLPGSAGTLAGYDIAQTWSAVQTFAQTNLKIRGGDTNALILKPNETMTADRTLNLKVNDTDRTVDLSGNLVLGGTLTTAGAWTHTGAHTLGITTTANTTVTLPTTGTLATLAGSETFTNKIITALQITAGSTIDTNSAGTLGIGNTNATTITLGKTGQTVVIAGNLQIDGDTTTANTATLDVEDTNITVNKNGNDATSEGAGLTVERTGTDGSIIYADAAASKFKIGAVGAEIEVADISTAQTITNKSINSDNNTITNITNADIKASAAIVRSKLASGTADYVLINNGTGVMSEEAQLSVTRGGTGQSSVTGAFDALAPTTTKGDVIVHNGSNNIRVGVGSDNQILTADSAQASGVKWGTAVVSNPMTTAGDIIYSSDGSGTPARLAIGSGNALMYVSGGLPAWSNVSNLNFDGTKLGIGGTATSANLEVYSNTTAIYAAIVDQDHITGHGLQINTDGTGAGSLALQINSGIGQIFAAASDGDVTMCANGGGLGIGTVSPTALLALGDSNTATVGGTGSTGIDHGSFHWRINDAASFNRLYLDANYGGFSNVMEVRADGEVYLTGGNVGIGTTSPGALLGIQDNATSGFNSIRVTTATGATRRTGIQFYHGSTETGGIDVFSTDAVGGSSLAFRSDNGNMSFGVQNKLDAVSIDVDGKVGIGTTSPLHPVHIEGADLKGLQIGAAGGQDLFLYGDNSFGSIIATNVNLGFSGDSGTTKHMVLTTTGTVGIGTTSPNYRAHIVDSVNSDFMCKIENSGGTSPYVLVLDTSAAAPADNVSEFFRCEDSAAIRMRVYSDGDVWTSEAGTLTSDINLKTKVNHATSKLADVMKLQVRNFEWVEQYHPSKVGEKKIGFIAQEFEQVFPGLVSEHNIARKTSKKTINGKLVEVPNAPIMRKGIKQGVLIPILVKAMQEQQEQIEQLKVALDILTTRIELLENK